MTRVLFFLIFISVATTIVSLIHYYFFVRLISDTRLAEPWRSVARIALVVLLVSLPASLAIGRFFPFSYSRYIVWWPYVWLGMMFYLFTAVLGSDLIRNLWALARRIVRSPKLEVAQRRLFARVAGLVCITSVTAASAVAIVNGAGSPTVHRVEVVLDKLPIEIDGFSVAQITDLHIGLTLGRQWLANVVHDVMMLRPDLIAVTGDLMDGSPERLRAQLEPIGKLSAPRGVYFVTGNHEYYSGVTEWLPVLKAMGMRVLRNEHVKIESNGTGFFLAGVDDYNASRVMPDHGPDLAKALRGRDPSSEVVLLAHQPRAVIEAARYDVGLVLSGHTHGGQIWPWHYLVRFQQPYVSGLHKHGKRTQIYVSQGAGYWGPPMRLGTTSEITQIILRAGNKERKNGFSD